MRLTALAAFAGILAQAPAPSQPPAARFRAGIDLLTVSAAVTDDQGRPVRDLQPSDFTVTVAGTPRKVLFARFTGSETRSGEAAVGTTPTVAAPARNAQDVEGRVVIFVVDRESMKSGSEKALLETAATVLDSLTPADAAGLLSLPSTGVELTREHDRVRQALELVTGTQPRQQLYRDRNITWNEALGFEQRDTRTISEVIERECSPTKRPEGVTDRCPEQLESQARELLAMGRAHVQTVMTALWSLSDQLAPLRGSKHIIFLSGGLPFGQDLIAYFEEFSKKAAAARVVFYAVHLDQPASDASDRTAVSSAFGGNDLTQGLTTMTGMTGGAYFEGIGRAVGVFDRIRAELSNYYDLGVETLPADASGQPQPIEVKVNRPGLSVRARRQVTLPDAATVAARFADPVKALLAQPTDVGGLPVTISAYTTRGDEASTLRILLAGEIGDRTATAPADWGFIVLNEGNVVANGRASTDAAAAAPWAVTTSVKLVPGQYRVRFAASDAAGRAGVTDIPLTVGLRAAGPLQVSDVIVGTADGGRLRPNSSVRRGTSVHALAEIYSNDPAQLERTTAVLEIIPAGSADPVQRYLMARRSSPSSAAILIVEGDFTTASLPPGRYTASVVAVLDQQPVGRVSRVFDITGS